jgi:hypothetical protein
MRSNKVQIALVVLGHSGLMIDVKSIVKRSSKVYEIISLNEISNLPLSNIDDGFLDQKYEKDDLSNYIKCPAEADIALGVMPCRFSDNFYLHRVNSKCAILSIYGIEDILAKRLISIENFVIKQLYEVSAIYLLSNDLTSDQVYSFVHEDTRGCLFDLNGNKRDIVYNTESPIICDSCKAKFQTIQIPQKTIKIFESELKRIKKPIMKRLEIWIQCHPFISVLSSGIIAITLNIIASALWEKIK